MKQFATQRSGGGNPGLPGSGGRAQGGWSLIEVLAAVVVVGLGVALFVKVQGMSNRGSGTNSKQLVAGRMIEKFVEDTRILIAQDSTRNWPPRDTTLSAVAPSYITLTSTVSNAYSPKDNQLVTNVKRLDIACRWTSPIRDSLKVSTYVAKRF